MTSHHDHNHCFKETLTTGVLAGRIFVFGDWLPTSFIGRFKALCAIVRMYYISIIVTFQHFLASYGVLSREFYCDVVIIDGVSAPIPVFFLCGIPIVFYCHFPDKVRFLNLISMKS